MELQQSTSVNASVIPSDKDVSFFTNRLHSTTVISLFSQMSVFLGGGDETDMIAAPKKRGRPPKSHKDVSESKKK